jgi:uncharacterized protein (DUF1697 family)
MVTSRDDSSLRLQGDIGTYADLCICLTSSLSGRFGQPITPTAYNENRADQHLAGHNKNMSVTTRAPHTFAVFLRGINVGGIRIAMKDLSQVLAHSGFADVQTVLASGNVVLRAETDDPAVVKESVQSALRAAFGYDAWVIVKSREEVAAIIDGYPFSPAEDGVPRHAYAVITTGQDVVKRMLEDCPGLSPEERAAPGGDVLYWEVPKGSTLESKLSKHLAKAKYKQLTTTRNLNTMHKVLAKFPRQN